MEFLEKIYGYLQIEENKNLFYDLLFNYSILFLLIVVVLLFVKNTTSKKIENHKINIESNLEILEEKDISKNNHEEIEFTDRQIRLIDKLKDTRLNLQSRKIKLSDGLL